jgi:hypothetical protein
MSKFQGDLCIVQRNFYKFLIGIREIDNDLPTLLFGMKSETMKQMLKTFLVVQKFIQDEGHFTINLLLLMFILFTDLEKFLLLYLFSLFNFVSTVCDNG